MKFGPEVASVLVGEKSKVNILNGIRCDIPEVKMESMDILNDLLNRFGEQMQSEHEKIMTVCLAHLTHNQPTLRKRASSCIASLACTLSDPLLKSLVDQLQKFLKSIQASKENPNGKDVSIIQTIGGISRNVGFRLGPYLATILPLFLSYCSPPSSEDDEDDDSQREQLNEVRENCLYAIESFVIRCPAEVDDKITKIVELALSFATYDPNYNDDGSGEDEDGMEEEDEEDGDDYFSDDDDNSWKVRRGAVKVLAAAIAFCPKRLRYFYEKCSEKLISRFNEREESVRIEVLACFTTLLKATIMEIETDVHPLAVNAGSPTQIQKMRPSGDIMESYIPDLIAAAKKQLRSKSIKTKAAIFTMLKQLALTWQIGELLTPDWFDQILPATLESITSKASDSTLKLEALQFLNKLLQTHPFDAVSSFSYIARHADKLCAAVVAASKESWYKITTEVLNVIGVLVHQLRPFDTRKNAFATVPGVDYKKYITPLFDVVFPCLEGFDIDQEIKESSIYAAGEMVAVFGSDLDEKKFSAVLPIFLSRLRNEITRTPMMRALIAISASTLKIDLSSVLSDIVAELSSFLRQNSRSLKQDAVEALISIIKKYGQTFSISAFENMIKESGSLLVDTDLHMANLVLQLNFHCCQVNPAVAPSVKQHVLPQMCLLIISPLLHGGAALDSLLKLFAYLSTLKEGSSPGDLTAMLTQHVLKRTLPKQSVRNVARAIAVITLTRSDKDKDAVVGSFLSELSTDANKQQLLLLVLGEIGRSYDLTGNKAIYDTLVRAFNGDNDDAKSAAALAFGNIAVGNIPAYLPVILKELAADDKKYLILTALRVVIVYGCAHVHSLSPHVNTIVDHLLTEIENKEEAVRNMVAECFGKLTLIDSDNVFPRLKALINASVYAKCVAVTSLKV